MWVGRWVGGSGYKKMGGGSLSGTKKMGLGRAAAIFFGIEGPQLAAGAQKKTLETQKIRFLRRRPVFFLPKSREKGTQNHGFSSVWVGRWVGGSGYKKNGGVGTNKNKKRHLWGVTGGPCPDF